jgi:hypothetical protein
MFPLVATVLTVATAPPPGFAGTASAVSAATAGAFADTAGLKVDLGSVPRSLAVPGLADKPRTFWQNAELVARAAKTRPDLGGETGPLRFAGPALKAGESSCFGAFRVAARRLRAVADLDTGGTNYELELDLMWEPRLPVFRASAEPTLNLAKDDRGTAVTAKAASVSTVTTGARHAAALRLNGLTRQSVRVAELQGEFRVTASRALLPFAFTTPGRQMNENVVVALVSFTRVEDRWEVTLDLEYPPGGPVFESFEADAYLAGNVTVLTTAGKEHAPASYELTERGRQTRAVYRFKGLPATVSEYTLRYSTPTPPQEFAVPFTLSDLPLP